METLSETDLLCCPDLYDAIQRLRRGTARALRMLNGDDERRKRLNSIDFNSADFRQSVVAARPASLFLLRKWLDDAELLQRRLAIRGLSQLAESVKQIAGLIEPAYSTPIHRQDGFSARKLRVLEHRCIEHMRRLLSALPCQQSPTAPQPEPKPRRAKARMRKAVTEADATLPIPPPVAKPVWDKDSGTLIFAGKVVKTVRNLAQADNVGRLLTEFEELGWPNRMDDPLPPGGTPERLKDAIKCLNKNLLVLRFSRDGQRGVRWTFASPGAPPAVPPRSPRRPRRR